VDYVNRKIFFKAEKGKKALSQLSKEMTNSSLELSGDEEPFEQYLVKSLAFGRKWEKIISEHKLDKLFSETKYQWQTRELWIAYICWASFKWKEALYLTYKMLSRSKEAIQKQLNKVKLVDYYRDKYVSPHLDCSCGWQRTFRKSKSWRTTKCGSCYCL
jgi:hypothetical protein